MGAEEFQRDVGEGRRLTKKEDDRQAERWMNDNPFDRPQVHCALRPCALRCPWRSGVGSPAARSSRACHQCCWCMNKDALRTAGCAQDDSKTLLNPDYSSATLSARTEILRRLEKACRISPCLAASRLRLRCSARV